MNKLKTFWNYSFAGIPAASLTILYSLLQKIFDRIKTQIARGNLGFCGKGVLIQTGTIIRLPKNIKIFDNVKIGHNVIMGSEVLEGILIINEGVTVVKNVSLDFSGGLTIGKNTLISENSFIYTHDHGHNPKSKPKTISLNIGENVWVGVQSVILSGVKSIGNNSIVAAGSIVTKSVPENVIVAGNPAKIIKQL